MQSMSVCLRNPEGKTQGGGGGEERRWQEGKREAGASPLPISRVSVLGVHGVHVPCTGGLPAILQEALLMSL